MHIYIDESGSFCIPKRSRKPAISCLGALTIPTSQHDEIIHDFIRLASNWPKERNEVKGRLLQEDHFDAALAFYAERGLLLEAVAIDLGTHDTSAVLTHKMRAAANILENVSDKMQPTLKAELRSLASAMHSISVPEYVQSVALTEVVDSVFRTNFRWFPLTAPSELASFAWIVDGKEVAPTRMERLWNKICLPWLQTNSLKEPLLRVAEGDYSHLPAGIQKEKPRAPDHLATQMKNPNHPFRFFDIGAVLKDRRFTNSVDHIGLQMADVAISAVRRAMVGNLHRRGWQRLGSILVRPARHGQEVVNMIHIGDGPMRWEPKPLYYEVLLKLRQEALPVLPKGY
jgi:Protein of unknown function (DUF3800)